MTNVIPTNENKLINNEKKNNKPVKAAGKRRKWFFTLWKMDINWEELKEDYSDIIRYLVVQKELTPTTNKEHWQGAIHMRNACRMNKIRRLFNLGKGADSGDIRPQMGNNKQVRDYCLKARTSLGFQFEFGKPSLQGIREDIEDIKKRIEKGENDYHISQDHFGQYAQKHKWFAKYRGLHLAEKSKKFRHLNVKFLSGPTACGKTRYAYEKHDINDIFKINCSDGLKWFDGYEGQSVLILDEFKNQVPLTRLLDLLDGYQCRLEYKGGMTYAQWTTVYITSNLHEEEVYPSQTKTLVEPLWRRITECVNFWNNRNKVALGNTSTKATITLEDLSSPSESDSEEDTSSVDTSECSDLLMVNKSERVKKQVFSHAPIEKLAQKIKITGRSADNNSDELSPVPPDHLKTIDFIKTNDRPLKKRKKNRLQDIMDIDMMTDKFENLFEKV